METTAATTAPDQELENSERTLDKRDRCDACGAEALAYATKENFSELLFCLHHFKKSEENLVKQGFETFSPN